MQRKSSILITRGSRETADPAHQQRVCRVTPSAQYFGGGSRHWHPKSPLALGRSRRKPPLSGWAERFHSGKTERRIFGGGLESSNPVIDSGDWKLLGLPTGKMRCVRLARLGVNQNRVNCDAPPGSFIFLLQFLPEHGVQLEMEGWGAREV